MERGKYAEAASAYRSVADWSEGGPFPERAQALYLSGLMLEDGREFERSLETYRLVEARFPESPFARRAHEAAARLEAEGKDGYAFRRRFESAYDVLEPALREAASDPEGARADLERALALLTALLNDRADDPRASDVALAMGDAHARLGALEEACVDFERSVTLAERNGAREGARGAGDLPLKRARLDEGRRAIVRRRLDRAAKAILAGIACVLVILRPWCRFDRRALSLGLVLLAVDVLVASLAAALAWYVRHNVDDHSPIAARPAALLVLVPALAGEAAALGLATSLRGRKGRAVAGTVGAIAAIAAATCLVHAFELFPYLDKEL